VQTGDIVMFSDENSKYAKYFYGAIGTVKSTKNGYCSVRWRSPGPLYFGRRVPASSFPIENCSVLGRSS